MLKKPIICCFTFATLFAHLAYCAETEIPLSSGVYQFQHRFAEHPSMQSIRLDVAIDGRRITLINNEESNIFPKGVVAEGILLWHKGSGQWIIGQSETDQNTNEVGGCSEGPEVVDLDLKIYWTC